MRSAILSLALPGRLWLCSCAFVVASAAAAPPVAANAPSETAAAENALFRELTTARRRSRIGCQGASCRRRRCPMAWTPPARTVRWPNWPTTRIPSRHCSASRSSRPSSSRSATSPPRHVRHRPPRRLVVRRLCRPRPHRRRRRFAARVRGRNQIGWRRFGAQSRRLCPKTIWQQRRITPATDERWFAGVDEFVRPRSVASHFGGRANPHARVGAGRHADRSAFRRRSAISQPLVAAGARRGRHAEARASRIPIMRPADI